MGRRSVACDSGILTYQLIRKPVKNINLRVKPDGNILVSANRAVPTAYIDDLVREKEKFILRALDRLERRRQQEQENNGSVGIGPQEGRQPEEEKPLTRAEKERLLLLFEGVCREVYPLFHGYAIPYPVLKVRKMKTLWGSCHTKKGSITLNSKLAEAPPACIRYVMIHEMAHFIHPNHSPEFWRVVEEMMPEWRERRKELKRL